jgi:hypothetical protein
MAHGPDVAAIVAGLVVTKNLAAHGVIRPEGR